MRGAVRNKEEWKGRRVPTQDPSTNHLRSRTGTSDTCDLDALQYAVAHPAVFKLGMDMRKNISKITRACPTKQGCYMASVQVTVPEAAEGAGPYVFTAFINNNRDTTVRHDTPTMTAPCL